MSMNPRATTDKIREDYEEYISSILRVRDRELSELACREVRKAEFVKGPYLETTLPFVDGKSLKELAEEGLVSREFGKMGSNIHYDSWKLRIHQERALRRVIQEGKNIVVSTGTGSGKTECYLYPIFNSLMREKENGTLDSGVRAMLIFPMNALANDQRKKLRKLLREYPDITFGSYTGETKKRGSKETSAEAEQRLHREYDEEHLTDTDTELRKSLPNELMCREQMAETPPHILLTNYAMLEYLLLRPDTAPFFDDSRAKNWRFIVIDEAHSYKGANGTEIAFLLRRLKERIRHNMHDSFRCIATSATLGSEDAKTGLAEFAQKLFDEPFSEEDVITTERLRRERPADGHRLLPTDYRRLKEENEGKSEAERWTTFYEALSKDLRLFDLYAALDAGPRRMEDIAGLVFGDISSEKEREDALITLIELASAARQNENESALLPARYHLFVKSLEGMFARFVPRKEVYLDRRECVREGEQNYTVFELANCQKCGQEYFVGHSVPEDGNTFFSQTSREEKPEYLFISGAEESELETFDEDDLIEESNRLNGLDRFRLCLACGRITPYAELHNGDCCLCSDPKKIVTVYRLRYSGKNSESNCCPCCGATDKGIIKRFLTANQPATFAVAKSLYDAIPPRPDVNGGKKESAVSGDIFDDFFFEEDEEAFLPDPAVEDENGRKLLIFSDNRQEAAFFAGYFENKYNQIMWRRVMVQSLKSAGRALNIEDLIDRVLNEADRSGLYTFDKKSNKELSEDQKRKMAAHYVVQEFLSPDSATGLEGLGQIRFEPEPMSVNPSAKLGELRGNEIWSLLRYMMDTLREKGTVSYPDCIRAGDEFFEPRNHESYFREQGSDQGRHVFGFIPQDKNRNKRLAFLVKLDSNAGSAENDYEGARKLLKECYDKLIQLKKYGYVLPTNMMPIGTAYALNYKKWTACYVEDSETLFRCRKCGRVYSYSLRGICPAMKCDGTLEEVSAGEIKNQPYYGRLFRENKPIPMAAREHTAQLSAETARNYQTEFEQGKVNVLSCSTTFEMGVDVGELEATFQRNVPPETSNYIQRAGRAGRRTSSAAFSVTFARRNSHDMTFFQEPEKIIAGKIHAPVLETDNEKIASRHLNSVVVAWFFRQHPEFFRGNTGRIVDEQGVGNMALALKEALLAHPSELLNSLHSVFPVEICEQLGVDNWEFVDDLTGAEGSLTRAISERQADIQGLTEFCREAAEGSTALLSRVISAKKLIETLTEEQSINFLSGNGVLPKYGFPIDSVSLDVLSGSTEDAKKIDLTRDLKMAISEFAPPSQIVANGMVWKSYAINTVPNKGWPAYIYHECTNCKQIAPPTGNVVDATVNLKEVSSRACSVCGAEMKPKLFIIPLFGFSTQMGDKPKKVGDSRPSTYYITQTQFWGLDELTEREKAEARTEEMIIGRKAVTLEYSPGGKLFVLNQGRGGGGLRICPRCGFATDFSSLPKGDRHDTKYGTYCANKNSAMITASLGNSFSTDILRLTLPEHTVRLEQDGNAVRKNQRLSVLYALLEGAARALDISRDDISGCLTEDGRIVLYDDTAGGSGFVKRVFLHFEDVVRSAREVVSGICGCTEETSCYGCLRNYANQYYHDELSRGLAYRYLSWFLDENAPVEEPSAPISAVIKKLPNPKRTGEPGLKVSGYIPEDSSGEPDNPEALEELLEEREDPAERTTLQALADYARGGGYEHPLSMECISVEQNIWPELLWGRSQVALFVPEERDQYQILKKYDWRCYMLGEPIDPAEFFSHIVKGE